MATSVAVATVAAETHNNNNKQQGKKILTTINKVNLFQGYQKQIQARVQLYKNRANKEFIVHAANNNKHTYTLAYVYSVLMVMCYILIHIHIDCMDI